MSSRYVMSTVAALFCAGALASAEPQATPEQQQPREQQPATQTEPRATQPGQGTTTLVGCLYRERDIPGRSPNVAERAGVLEDYILAGASIRGQGGAPGAVGTAGKTEGAPSAGSMYKIELIDDDRLRPLVGKRVEVTGKIDAERGDTKGTPGATAPRTDKSVGPDQIELPEFEAASIREVEGTCPATPPSGK